MSMSSSSSIPWQPESGRGGASPRAASLGVVAGSGRGARASASGSGAVSAGCSSAGASAAPVWPSSASSVSPSAV
eukprot:3370016-Alexandrium_andersonii.AAC.1